jgi:hypothetical protein
MQLCAPLCHIRLVQQIDEVNIKPSTISFCLIYHHNPWLTLRTVNSLAILIFGHQLNSVMFQLQEAAVKSLRKYGVGSCGPRGFYGTVGKKFSSIDLMVCDNIAFRIQSST